MGDVATWMHNADTPTANNNESKNTATSPQDHDVPHLMCPTDEKNRRKQQRKAQDHLPWVTSRVVVGFRSKAWRCA